MNKDCFRIDVDAIIEGMEEDDRQFCLQIVNVVKKLKGYFTRDLEAVKQLFIAFFFGSSKEEHETRTYVRDRFGGMRMLVMDGEHRHVQLEKFLGELKRLGIISDKLTAGLLAVKLYAYEKKECCKKHVKFINAIQHAMSVGFDGVRDQDLRSLLQQVVTN